MSRRHFRERRWSARELYLSDVVTFPDLDDAERAFFKSIQLPNGTYKETYRNRLDDVNLLIVKHLQESRTQHLDIMDVGASSGVSTDELHETIVRHGLTANITAVDLAIKAYIIRLLPKLCALVDGDAQLLQLDLFGLVLNHWYMAGKSPSLLLKRALLAILKHYFERRVSRQAETGINGTTEEISLLSRRLSSKACISFLEHDVLRRFPKAHRNRYGCIRAANILNKAYFSDGEIRLCIRNLSECLSDHNAILCIARTDETDGKNNGGIYRFSAKGVVQKVSSIGGQSEIDSILGGQRLNNA